MTNTTGWIKLHRKILDNETLQNPNSFMLFTKLLLLVDHKTGTVKIGRKKLSDLCGMNESTCYRTYQRLKKSGMLLDDGNSLCLTYSICNWGDYQTDGNNQRSTKSGQPPVDGNTITRRKNKEERKTPTVFATPVDSMPDLENVVMDDELVNNDVKKNRNEQKLHPDVQAVIKYFEAKFGLKLKDIRNQRNMAFNLTHRYGLQKTLSAIDIAYQALPMQYAPNITDLRDLWEKWDKLAAYLIKSRATQQGRVATVDEGAE